jgi:transcription termination factor Rho
MSVDATTLERSALERKDRDELLTIAQALGAKPASRATKATIVNLILEVTGVSAGGAAPAPSEPEPAAVEPEPAPVDDTTARQAPAEAEVAEEAGETAREADEPDADDAPEDE